jgi:leader peptidase (prepilin peptidase) / N-methyltransferase
MIPENLIYFLVNEFPWYVFLTVLSFPLGACIGSFLNVCVYRIPLDLSVVAPRSFCPSCRTPIPWYLNMPILSYLLLRGKCRFCRAKITPRYALIEALTGLLFLLVWLKYFPLEGARPLHLVPVSDPLLVPVYWLAISGLILGTFVDFEHLIIPDRVTLGGILAGLLLSALVPSLHGETLPMHGLLWSSLGALAGWFLLWGAAILGTFLLKKEAMGFGDVKLIGAIGAFLGTKAVLFTILTSSLIGSAAGIVMVLAGKKKMQSRIPYGPYLALAAVIWILWGASLWSGYLKLFSMDNVTTTESRIFPDIAAD